MKTFKNLCLVLIVVLASSCDVGKDKELNYGTGSYVTQFPFAEKTAFFLKDDAVIYDYSVPIEMVGGNGLALTADTAVSYEVDTAMSTAVEGVNFDFVGSTSTVIPAGSTFSSVPLKIYSGTLDDQNPPVLVLKLTSVTSSGTDVVTSGNKGSIAITLQGTCSSDLGGSYSVVTTRISPAGGPYTFPTEVIDEVATGTYNTTTVGQYYAPGGNVGATGSVVVLGGATDAGYTFKEVCGRVAIETQQLAGVYSNLVKQSAAQYAASTVNPSTGVITTQYSIFFSGNTVERTFKSIYTPL